MDNILLEHVRWGYPGQDLLYLSKILQEEHGYVPNVESYIQDILSAFYDKFKQKRDRVVSVTDKDITFTVQDRFFSDIKVTFIAIESSENLEGKANVDECDFRNGKLVGLEIKIYYCNQVKRPYLTLQETLAHELLHAYEEYNRLKKEIERLEDIKLNYGELSRIAGTEIKEKLRDFIYVTDPVERNAIFGQIYPGLLQFKDYVKTAQNLYKCIEELDVYRYRESGQSFVDLLDYIESSTDQKNLMKSYSNQTGYVFKTYGQFKKHCRRLWARWCSKFRDVTSKAVGDVWNEKGIR